MYKKDLALNNQNWLICHKTQPNNPIYLIYIYKEDLALNNQQWLICHKTQPNNPIYLIYIYKEDLALNNQQWLICHKTQPNNPIYLIYIYKEDLALNNQQWLICHKTQQDLGWGRVMIRYIRCIYTFFSCLFRGIFFTHIDRPLLRRRAVPQSAIFSISYRLGMPGIMLMCSSVPFLIILRSFTITRVTFSQLFQYLLLILYSLTDMLSVGTVLKIRSVI